MDLSLNGKPVTRARILAPRVGAWVADVEVDTDEDLIGAQDLAMDGVTLRGAVHRGGVAYGRWTGRLVGGSAGLPEPVAPVSQYTTTLATALADVLREAGETLSATSGDLSTSVTRWHRAAGTAANAVADVARAAGMAWRVLFDGTVWLGVETWPAAAAAGVELLDHRPEVGRLELGGDAAALLGILPGQTLTLDGVTARVGCIEHTVDATTIRSVIHAEPSERPAGRLLDSISRLVAALTRRVDYLAHYPARVVAQRADGTLDLIPDDSARVAPCTGVPIRTGLPGVAVTVPVGARVLLGYEGGDPARPVATLWEAETVTTLKVNGSSTKAARDGDATSDGTLSVVASSTGVPPVTTLTITYTPPGGAPQVTTVTGLLGAGVAAGAPSFSLAGVITEGSDVVRIP